jgi:sugar O-acyltransferase (sialic acid O-acetyltransferase NeuD family)
MSRRIAVLGAGGLAREIEWLIHDLNVDRAWTFAGFVVSDLSRLGEFDQRERIIGDYAALANVDAVVLGIGSPSARLKVAAEIADLFPRLEWPSLVHPSVRIDRRTLALERGATVAAGVIGTVNITLCEFSFVNLACTLGHEAVVGRGCVLNPTVNISGGVELGEGVLVGTGSQVLQYLRVGDHATVGAGAVVTKHVESGATVVGIPARPGKTS